MNRPLIFTLIALIITATWPATAKDVEVITKTVTFKSGDDVLSAFMARPPGTGPFPAVIVIQEWWGVTPWIKSNAVRFADRGYVALAVDLYRGKVAGDAELAHELMRGLPDEQAIGDMKAGLAWLRAQTFVKKDRIGAIGWCMGGGYSLKLALAEELEACVICYGRVITDSEKLRKNKAPILGIFGADDRGIPIKTSVNKFSKSLATAKIPADIKVFEKSGHAFMNPGNKRGYNADTAALAWKASDAFLDKNLKGE